MAHSAIARPVVRRALSAPPELQALLRHVGKGKNILERLISSETMSKAWKQIDKRVNEKRGWRSRDAVYQHLWGSMVTALHRSRRQQPSRKATRLALNRTARMARALKGRIRNNRLDLPLGLEAEWTSMSEALEQLAMQADELGAAAMTEKRTVDRNTRDRELNYFIRDLAESLEYWLGGAMMGCLAAIASTVFQKDVSRATVKRALRR